MQNEATNTPQTFVVVGGNMLRNMMKNSGDACPILLGWWEKLDSKSEVFLVQAMFSKKLQIIAFFQMQLKRLPCPSGGYWSCSRASHVQFPLLHTPTHCRSDCGWFFLKGIRLYMWAHKTLCQQSCWPGTFCVEAMTFQLYLTVLQLFSEPRIPPQPKMFCNTSYITNISHSPSLWNHQQQNHTSNPSASWWVVFVSIIRTSAG